MFNYIGAGFLLTHRVDSRWVYTRMIKECNNSSHQLFLLRTINVGGGVNAGGNDDGDIYDN